MAVKMGIIMFFSMLTCLLLAVHADEATASKAKISYPYGCNEVDEQSGYVANFNGNTQFDDKDCGAVFTLKYDGSEITVTFVGGCDNCQADIVLSNEAYEEVAGDDNSNTLDVEYDLQ